MSLTQSIFDVSPVVASAAPDDPRPRRATLRQSSTPSPRGLSASIRRFTARTSLRFAIWLAVWAAKRLEGGK